MGLWFVKQQSFVKQQLECSGDRWVAFYEIMSVRFNVPFIWILRWLIYGFEREGWIRAKM